MDSYLAHLLSAELLQVTEDIQSKADIDFEAKVASELNVTLPDAASEADLVSEDGDNPDIVAAVADWRDYFKEKRKEREQRQQYSKAPYWVLKPLKPIAKDKEVQNIVERVHDNFLKARSLFWDEERECFYFVDEIKKTIVRYKPNTDDMLIGILELEDQGNPSFIIPVLGADYLFLTGIGHNLYQLEWSEKRNKVGNVELILKQDQRDANIFYGKADPVGRIVIGSLVKEGVVTAEPVVLDEDGREITNLMVQGYLKVYEAPVSFTHEFSLQMDKCTGLAWDWRASKLFAINAAKEEILVFVYNIKEGKIGQQLDSIKWSKIKNTLGSHVQGSPNCLTCDINDNLWVGCSMSGQIVAIDPIDLKILNLISLGRNIKDILSIGFGHRNRDVLYVTTANNTEVKKTEQQGYTEGTEVEFSSLVRVRNVGTRALADYKVRMY